MNKTNKNILKFSDYASCHAEKRVQARSKHKNVDFLIEYSDRIIHVPEEKKDRIMKAYSFTEERLHNLVKDNIIDQQTADKCKNLVILISSDQIITTVLHQRDGRKGRVYRKNIKNCRDRYFKKLNYKKF